jgi:hypothetical protein
MTTTARIEVVGVKDTINQLNKLDKELAKEFKASATQVAQPAMNAAKNMYTKVPLSGMSRNWKSQKRTPPQNIKGFDVSRAKAGVQMKFDTRRNAVGVILIIQKDQAAAIFETAGRANSNRLSNNLDPVRPGRTRLIGPAVYSARRGIEREMKSVIADASRTVQKGL